MDLKIKTLKNLKYLFLISFIVIAIVLVCTIISIAIGNNTNIIDENKDAALAIMCISYTTIILRMLIFVATPIITFFGMNIDKDTKIGFYLTLASSVLFLLGIIFAFTIHPEYWVEVLYLLGAACWTVGIYFYVRGIFLTEKGRAKNPFHRLMVLSLSLILLNQILSFIAAIVIMDKAMGFIFAILPLTISFTAFLLLYFAGNQTHKLFKDNATYKLKGGNK